jgi:hypothetical protein
MGRPGLIGTMARTAVVAGTASAVVGGMSRHSASKSAAAQQEQQAAMQSQAELAELQQQVSSLQAQQAVPAQATGAPAGAGDPGSMSAELERLASFKTAGILSEEEFQAAKAKLLS